MAQSAANKNNGSTLVMFTESYPFAGFSEKAFVESELETLTRHFDRVTIVPRNRREELSLLPSLPNTGYSTFWLDAPENKYKWVRSVYSFKSFFGFKVGKEEEKKKSLTFGMTVLAMEESIERWILREKIDLGSTVFYTFWFDEWTAALSLFAEKRNQRLKIATRVHSFYETSARAKYLKGLAARTVSLFLPASKSAEKRLKKLLPQIEDDRIKTVFLGSKKREGKIARKPNTALTFFTACRLEPEKSLLQMLEFMDALATARGYQIRWMVAGDGSLRNEFLAAVGKNRNINLEIELLGAIDNGRVHEILRSGQIDWTLLLSPDEGLPIILCESISYGVPVVANDVGGISEVVTDETGLLLAAYPEKEEFVRGIAPYLDSALRYRALAESAEEYWRKNFDAYCLREKSTEMLEQLL